ncbi:MAG: tetratricopeptide repeat protein [Candidatus Omnitrophica bacterium]|nr:tetratricopeptide repeat protein [Candidatus Omnitrophota bacterium]MCA9425014.1 tetratricopeptide repeat protein [Candidatus Omnitrophota bacterium]MCA9437036.1 tetratricopeptide repeat protein [Candidatus Omnitrophota bacterium]MCA9444864.1 tetratricopeptide repeat protein [Candidatus Omnitrophota bacterium]MCA9449298.1 tetratricopeptide repeat protein [Candidatus Omnitrophota bacterium]
MIRKLFLPVLLVLPLVIADNSMAQLGSGNDSAPLSASSEVRLNVGAGPIPTPTEKPKEAVEVDTHGKGIAEIFQLANQSYEADDLEKAAAYYRAIEDRGLVNGNLYFNMGNTFFRMGDFGKAILYYEKARKLHPRSPDLLHNLAYARTFLIDKEDQEDHLPGSLETLLLLHRQTTRNETFILLGVLNLLLVLCLLARLFRFRFTERFYFGYLQGAIVILFVLQLFSAGFKVWDEDRTREAIVLQDSVKATASPGSNETLYELNSGTKVVLRETRDGYSRIEWNHVPAFVEEDVVGEI